MAQSLLDQAMGSSQLVTMPPSASNAASAPSTPSATGSLLDQAMTSDAATTPQSGTDTAHDLTTAEYAALPKEKQAEYDQHIRAGRSIFDPAIGFVKGVGDTVNTLSGLISRVAPSVVRPQDVQNVKTIETAKPGTLQIPGKVGESVAEFFLGDEALKGLSVAERLGLATKVTKLAESNPMIAKIIGHGLAAVRGGAVTTAQQLAHGATPTDAATAGGIATGLGAGAGAATDIMPAIKTAINGGQSTVSEAIQDAAQTAADQAELRSAKIKATEPMRVHPPEIDPTVRDHARLNPFPGEDVKIKTVPGMPATETEEATNPTARITGPNGSAIELELDGKTARVKGIINSGKPGDGQRLYDNAIEWAKDSGYDTFEGDKVQTQEGKTAWQRISERHNARLSDKGISSIDLTGSRPVPAPVAPNATPTSAETQPGFKEWFGNSKVTNEQGKPMRVFHGTRASKNFDVFSTEGPPINEEGEASTSGSGADPTAYMGAHFAKEPEVANKFASGEGWMRSRYESSGDASARVMPSYLKMENPKNFGPESNLRNFIYQGKATGYAADALLEKAMKADGIEDVESEEADKWMHQYDSNPAFRAEQNRWILEQAHLDEGEENFANEFAQDLAGSAKDKLRRMGHDGVIYKNQVEGGTGYMVFDPNQIKSSISGDFSKYAPKVPTTVPLTVDTPKPAPSAGIRTTIEDVSNAVKAKSQGIYQQLDQASGGRWQRYDDALKNIQDKMDEVNGVDDDAYDRLETKRNDIETSQSQMIEDLKGKGIDPKTADAAVAHYKQAMALRDLDKAVKASTTGDIASGATKSESVNPKAFTARIQKLYDSGRLKQAVGDSGAKALLQEAYAAKSAQAVQQVVKRIAVYAGIGAAMGAGAHATHIFNHVTGNVEPIQ